MEAVIAKYWYHCSLIILAGITLLSLIPLPQLPEVPGSDKTHHLVAYAALMLPVALQKPKHWVFIGCFFIAWSGVIELVQPFVNRYAEWLDLFANVVGLMIGLLLGLCIRILIAKTCKNHE